MTDRPKNDTEADAPGLWRDVQAAKALGCARSGLEKGRLGQGPFAGLPYVKFGRSVRYRPEDVRAFIAASVTTAADVKAAPKPPPAPGKRPVGRPRKVRPEGAPA